VTSEKKIIIKILSSC